MHFSFPLIKSKCTEASVSIIVNGVLVTKTVCIPFPVTKLLEAHYDKLEEKNLLLKFPAGYGISPVVKLVWKTDEPKLVIHKLYIVLMITNQLRYFTPKKLSQHKK